MDKTFDLYRDIAERTDGDVYIGVVGPVRTGKSTLIARMMEKLVLPAMAPGPRRDRLSDELPQSGSGRTIMTTQPKFVPGEAVTVTLGDQATVRVRMVDSVGYLVEGALGTEEDGAARMVHTPWFDYDIPFEQAAETGTRKVIADHATIGLVVTTDGSISDIPREEYAEAEERVIRELQELQKPFAVLLNCERPSSAEAQELAEQMQQRYGVPVLAVNCLDMTEADIRKILSNVLMEFPVKEIKVNLPRWILSLQKGHWLKTALYDAICSACGEIRRINHVAEKLQEIESCEQIAHAQVTGMDLGNGKVMLSITVKPNLFYDILSEASGLAIGGEEGLLPCLCELARIKKEYDKVKGALEEVAATGYGIVMPSLEELTLEEPQIVKQGGRYGVRLRASAPSIHMMRADITTEVSPIVGSEKQSEELVMSLLQEFEDNPQKIWESNIFGKSLHELVNEGLHNKLYRMPADARIRMQETIERIINEGCNGLICIIL